MLKFLTQKLKNQSLAEVCPTGMEGKQTRVHKISSGDEENCDKKDKVYDSSSESDEENAEICSITKGLDSCDETAPPQPEREVCTFQSPNHSPSAVAAASRTPFRQMHLNSCVSKQDNLVDPMKPLDFRDSSKNSRSNSSSENNPVQKVSNQSSPDCGSNHNNTTGVSTPLEHEGHSSEEELSGINLQQLQREKRKWSEVTQSARQGEGQGSSDEEVKDLIAMPVPSNFSSSPPKNAARLRRTVSPKLFLANVAPVCDSCWISPRKRPRQHTGVSPVIIQRPYLDLEKMQKSNIRKHASHHASKARLVKVKTLTGVSKPSRCMVDPELFTFRSLCTYNQMTPVEEPCAF